MDPDRHCAAGMLVADAFGEAGGGGWSLLDRHAGVDRRQHALVVLGVEAVPGLHRDHGGANPFRLAQERAGRDAEALGFVAGSDRAGGAGHRLHDDDRLAAQGRIVLLPAQREEGVEIEEQPLDEIGGHMPEICKLPEARGPIDNIFLM